MRKGKTAQILDKTQDSQAVIKLVEDLRQAILIYQVGVISGTIGAGQSFSNAFGIAISAAIDGQSGLTVDRKLPSIISFIETDGRWVKSSLLLTRF